jgi:NHLM bacteriocin system ABC transporter peptidase/ATP-binding protein
MEAVECGAAALGILLAHFGRIVPLAELRVECGVSRDGSNALNVIRAAERYGLEARGLSMSLDDAVKSDPPFIAFWNFNHFLVVEGFDRGRAHLNDPASGRRTVSFDEFDQAFTGVAIVLRPGAKFEKGGSEPGPVRSLAARLGNSSRDLSFCIAAGLVLVAPRIAVPMLIQVFVDHVLVRSQWSWARPLLLALVAVAAVHAVASGLQLRYLREFRTKLAIRLSSGFVWHVLRLPAGFFAQRYAGEVSSRIALNDGIAAVLSGRLATTAIEALMLAFYVVVMASYSVPLTAIGLGFVVANVLALRWVASRRIDANLRLRQETGKVAGVAIAGLQSIETLKASALESSFFTRWAGHYTKASAARADLGLANQNLSVLPVALGAVTTLLVLVVGGWLVIGGKLTIGQLAGFQILMGLLQRPVGTLVGLGGELQTLHGDMKRVDDVLQHPIDVETRDERPVEPADDDPPKLAGRLELAQVTFGYSRNDPPLIERLDLVIEPGQRLALVGGSGSGKSTIAKLVCGLYEPWAGEVRLDGRRRLLIPRRVLASSMAMVDQDLLFFAGTVRDNLTLWDATVSQDELEAACRDAEIHDVIQSLAGGYDAELREGAANLSGGQRQRLEIARALVVRPSVLVLDEATSALDAETEHAIDRNLRRRGCSTLVVAHRLSTIRDSEEILVLKAGRVVERGTHDELWSDGSEYRRLIRSEGEAL